MINKLLMVLIFSLQLFSLDYYFSLENNSINIQRNKNIDITFNEQALKIDDGDFLDDRWIQESVLIKENNLSGKEISFNTSVTHGLYTTFSLYPKNLKSNFKYFISVNGSRFKSKTNEIAIDKNISFTTANFLDIVYPKEVNLSISSNKIIPIYLNKPPSQDMDIIISSNDKNITISPISFTLSTLNYRDGEDIVITTNNKLLKSGNYYLTVKNNSLGIEKKIKLNMVEHKISLVTSIESSFSVDMIKNLSVNLDNPVLSPYTVTASSAKSGITVSKSKLIFTRDNFNIAQDIIINAKSLKVDTNATISLVSSDMNASFDIQVIVPIKEEPKKENNTTTNTDISIIKTTSLFSKFSWTSKADYKGKFSVFMTPANNSNKIKLGDVNNTTYLVPFAPNSEFYISVTYTDSSEKIGSIKIKTLKANLADSNKNGISDDLEELLETSKNTADTNKDGIIDIVQNHLLKMENKTGKTLGDYNLSSDIDGDKLTDFLELSMGRNPTKSDFNGLSSLKITVPSDGASLYLSSFDELLKASTVKTNHSASIIGYIGNGCLKNDILVANFSTKDDCKDITKESFSIGSKSILWVAMDDFGNIAYKKQILSIFKRSDSNDSSSNVIIFTVSNIKYAIRSKIGNSVSFGNLAKSNSYTNPIVYEKDTLASEFEFTNNIFDIIIQSGSGVASVIIKQPSTIPANSKFRIFKNGAYHTFDTTNGDKIYSTKGNNNDCSFNDIYQESLSTRDYCIKLEIKDGGSNDSDGLRNGSVSLIGGISIIPKIVSINDNDSIGCSSLHASGFNEKQIKFDYLMVFSFLISFAYVIRMFRRKLIN